MSRRRKSRSGALILFLILFLLIAAAAAAFFLLLPKSDPAPALDRQLAAFRPEAADAPAGIDAEIQNAAARCFSLTPEGALAVHFRSAEGAIRCVQLDPAQLTAGLADEMQTLLEQVAASARRRSELYADDGSLRPEIAARIYTEAVEARLARAEDYCRESTLPVSLRYADGAWQLEDSEAIRAVTGAPLPSMPGYEEAVAALKPIEFHYSLPDRYSPGPVPDSGCYGETTDPRVVAELLKTDMAQKLIDGQALDFDPERDMLGRPIYYYLDETILALVWQQDEHGAVGTFAEVLIADASQLRRKIADDTFGSYTYYYPTEFAAQTNAVVACSGDFYNSGRADFGLYVYDGRLMRWGLTSGQSCLITDEGDMLFTYENQFQTPEEAQRYIDENHVNFSLNFGPVIMDQGVDVTPYDYPFGEVLDTYARCAVGQLGKRHYLAMTINCESPDHYVYVTLRQAADSIIAHGVYNAYTLDGGQTGSILIGGRLINPVQFGVERPMSDIYYFATAIPND